MHFSESRQTNDSIVSSDSQLIQFSESRQTKLLNSRAETTIIRNQTVESIIKLVYLSRQQKTNEPQNQDNQTVTLSGVKTTSQKSIDHPTIGSLMTGEENPLYADWFLSRISSVIRRARSLSCRKINSSGLAEI